MMHMCRLPLHTYSGATFQQLQMRRFALGQGEENFLFISNMYQAPVDSKGNPYAFGYNTHSHLYRYV